MGGDGGAWESISNVVSFGQAESNRKKKADEVAQAGRDNLPAQMMKDRMMSVMEDMGKPPKEEEAAPEKAKKRSQDKTAGYRGRKSTILTSPLGIQGGETSGVKTLLGQ